MCVNGSPPSTCVICSLHVRCVDGSPPITCTCIICSLHVRCVNGSLPSKCVIHSLPRTYVNGSPPVIRDGFGLCSLLGVSLILFVTVIIISGLDEARAKKDVKQQSIDSGFLACQDYTFLFMRRNNLVLIISNQSQYPKNFPQIM